MEFLELPDRLLGKSLFMLNYSAFLMQVDTRQGSELDKHCELTAQ